MTPAQAITDALQAAAEIAHPTACPVKLVTHELVRARPRAQQDHADRHPRPGRRQPSKLHAYPRPPRLTQPLHRWPTPARHQGQWSLERPGTLYPVSDPGSDRRITA
jgi:hypothetical protein